jgi:hypothetical protein
MSDILNIRVTERELDLIMDLLHEAGNRTDANGQPAFELCHDLMEQSGRVVDEIEPTDLDGRTFSVAESDFIDHGMRAREMQKASSRAAERRTMRFGEFTVEEPRERSEQQSVDLWERPNDPTKW